MSIVRNATTAAGAYVDMRVDDVAVVRSYQIVSGSGTVGTYFQRLLVFTTARQKAPPTVLDHLLSRYPVSPR